MRDDKVDEQVRHETSGCLVCNKMKPLVKEMSNILNNPADTLQAYEDGKPVDEVIAKDGNLYRKEQSEESPSSMEDLQKIKNKKAQEKDEE